MACRKIGDGLQSFRSAPHFDKRTPLGGRQLPGRVAQGLAQRAFRGGVNGARNGGQFAGHVAGPFDEAVGIDQLVDQAASRAPPRAARCGR